MENEVIVVGSSSYLEYGFNWLEEFKARGAKVACISGAGRYLMDRGVDFDMYGCLEMGNVEIYSDDMKEMVKRFGLTYKCGIGLNFLFYFSVYANEWAKKTNLVKPRWMCENRWKEGDGKPWEVVPEEARIVVSEDVMYPRYVQVPYLRGTVTGGVLMALRLAWEGRFKEIRLFACQGYDVGMQEKVYADGIVGNSAATGEQWRRDTNESAAGTIAWMTNHYKDVKFYFHGEPAYSNEQMKDWKITFVE